MNFNLFCTNERNYTFHSVLDDADGKIQKIKCLNCGSEQQRVILSRRVAVSKTLYDQYLEVEKNAE